MSQQLMLFDPEENRIPPVIYEYFFLISPDNAIKENVKDLKRKLSQQIILSSENLHSVPHISLFKCTINSKKEQLIALIADNVLKGINGFNIKLNGHSIFKHGTTRSLVIKIDEAEQIKKVNYLLATGLRVRPFEITPHVTIARSIKISDINKISGNISDYDYEGEFLCNEITILRKEAGSTSRYEVFHKTILG